MLNELDAFAARPEADESATARPLDSMGVGGQSGDGAARPKIAQIMRLERRHALERVWPSLERLRKREREMVRDARLRGGQPWPAPRELEAMRLAFVPRPAVAAPATDKARCGVRLAIALLGCALIAAPVSAAREFLDTNEIARRALGRHHREEFQQLVAEYFAEWYAGQLSRNPRVQLSMPRISEDWAAVGACAPRRPTSLEMTYRLHRAADRWGLYDVEVNGRSHLRRIYTEFDRLILDEGYRELVVWIRADLAERRGRRVALPSIDTNRAGAGPGRAGTDDGQCPGP